VKKRPSDARAVGNDSREIECAPDTQKAPARNANAISGSTPRSAWTRGRRKSGRK